MMTRFTGLAIFCMIVLHATCQDRDLQYFRAPGFEGLNQFETPKDSGNVAFEGVKVRLGGDFAIQFQALGHSTKSGDTLAELGANFNLPTANLNIDVQLARGVRMSLVTYLSSRHHPEAWVKGGHVQFDRLDFIKKDFLNGLMNIMTIRTGMDEINYGDAHFRRSDNARAIYNPFVGNYIMDGFNTEVFGELCFQKNGGLLVAGVSNGKLNQSVVEGDQDLKLSAFGKLGYDRQFTDDLRVRLTASFYLSPGMDNGLYLYNGDRTGARYYNVLQIAGAGDNFRSGRFSPGFRKYTAFQINPFLKWKGLELFGIGEFVNGDKSLEITGGAYAQYGAELICRFGAEEKIYIGGRYNIVSGRDATGAELKNIDRLNVGGGWFMTNNVLMKAEYVSQQYTGNGWMGTVYQEAGFSGVMIEAVISF